MLLRIDEPFSIFSTQDELATFSKHAFVGNNDQPLCLKSLSQVQSNARSVTIDPPHEARKSLGVSPVPLSVCSPAISSERRISPTFFSFTWSDSVKQS